MIICFLAGIYLVQGSSKVEYRLWKNYGEIIYDYSGNNNLGKNGLSRTNTSMNFYPTDRGGYFPEFSLLRLPANEDIQNNVDVIVPYSMIFWINSLEFEGRIFMKWKPNNFIWIYRSLSSKSLCVNVLTNSIYSSICSESNLWKSSNN